MVTPLNIFISDQVVTLVHIRNIKTYLCGHCAVIFSQVSKNLEKHVTKIHNNCHNLITPDVHIDTHRRSDFIIRKQRSIQHMETDTSTHRRRHSSELSRSRKRRYGSFQSNSGFHRRYRGSSGDTREFSSDENLDWPKDHNKTPQHHSAPVSVLSPTNRHKISSTTQQEETELLSAPNSLKNDNTFSGTIHDVDSRDASEYDDIWRGYVTSGETPP